MGASKAAGGMGALRAEAPPPPGGASSIAPGRLVGHPSPETSRLEEEATGV